MASIDTLASASARFHLSLQMNRMHWRQSTARRAFAALAALWVMGLPVTQLAHAQAMVREAADGQRSPMPHHHLLPASAPHGSHHQHAANCCDLCPAGCQSVALPAPIADLCAAIESRAVERVTALHRFVACRPQHALPFSLAPPPALA